MASLQQKIAKSRKAVAQLKALSPDGGDQGALEAEVAKLQVMEDCAAVVERDAVAAAFSFICAKARSCGVPARFMAVVVGLPPRLPLAMRLGCARLPVIDGSYYSLCCGFGSLLGWGSSAFARLG